MLTLLHNGSSSVVEKVSNMAINFESKNLVDIVIEITAVKAKILLTDANVLELSERHEGLEDLATYVQDRDKAVRIYPNEFDEYVLSLRKAIGNIPDDLDSTSLMVKKTRALLDAGHDVEAAQRVVTELIRRRDVNDEKLIVNHAPGKSEMFDQLILGHYTSRVLKNAVFH